MTDVRARPRRQKLTLGAARIEAERVEREKVEKLAREAALLAKAQKKEEAASKSWRLVVSSAFHWVCIFLFFLVISAAVTLFLNQHFDSIDEVIEGIGALWESIGTFFSNILF